MILIFRFLPKPDSPCLYLDANTGPDGCAIFYKTEVFELVSKSSKILEVWGEESNQVVLSLNLRHKESRREICVATTHLKARSGDQLSSIRNEQGKDILQFLEKVHKEAPIILTGDFNDEPSEAVYKTLTENEKTPLISAYKMREGQQTENEETMEDVNLDFTTWKIRETGEQKHILDYIFHSPQLQTVSTLDMPTEQQVGEDRLSSLQFASDHLSLVADIRIY
jgi:nocturnin